MKPNIEEIWKDVEELDNLYQVSNHGRIKRKRRKNKTKRREAGYFWASEKILNIKPNTDWYPILTVRIDGVKSLFYIHRLVAKCFIPNPENKPQVNHINGNKKDNHVTNLEWVTSSENRLHAHRIGLKNNRGEKHSRHVLTESQVLLIRKEFSDNPNLKKAHIARQYKVTKSTIRALLNRKSWKHI